MSTDELIREVAARFSRAHLGYGHGTANAVDEAAWLVNSVLRRKSGASAEKEIRALAAKRIRRRTPLAYLLNEAWVGEHRFYVDERVIVPRSFIGELIEGDLDAWLPRRPRSALDLCTGSGCLGIMLALRYRRCGMDLADLSSDALAVARKNVSLHKVRGRVRAFRSDLYSGIPARRYDLIVTNPPYVKAASMRTLPDEYRREPKLALAGGRDGLDLVHRILAGAAARLADKGVLVCEIGHNRRALERAYPRTPFTWLETAAGDDYVFLLERKDLPA